MALEEKMNNVKYQGRDDYKVVYFDVDKETGNVKYFFLNEGKDRLKNGNVIATTNLKVAIDANKPEELADIGVVSPEGEEVIPFNNRKVRTINDDLLLVEPVTPVSANVVKALEDRSQPQEATRLVSAANTIKEKINSSMGPEGKFIFNDLFSEATIYDIDGNNKANNEYYSFIGMNNENLFLSKNDPEMDVITLPLGTKEEVVEEVHEETVEAPVEEAVDVSAVNVEENVVEDAFNNEVSEATVEPAAEAVEETVEAQVEAPVAEEVVNELAQEDVVETTPEEVVENVQEETVETPVEETVQENVAEEVVNELPVQEEAVEEVTPEEVVNDLPIQEEMNEEVAPEETSVEDVVSEFMNPSQEVVEENQEVDLNLPKDFEDTDETKAEYDEEDLYNFDNSQVKVDSIEDYESFDNLVEEDHFRKSDIDESTAIIEQMISKMKDQDRKISRLESQVTDQKEHNRALVKKNKELEDKLTSLNRENTRLEEVSSYYKRAATTLVEDNNNLKAQLADKDKLVDMLKEAKKLLNGASEPRYGFDDENFFRRIA